MDTSATPPPADQTPPTPVPPPAPMPLTPEEDIAKNKDLAALSYLWILSLVVYWTRKDSPFAQFHARQGVTLFVLSLIFMLVPVVSKLLQLTILVGSVYGFMNAAQGKKTNIPLIAAISRFDWKQLREDWQMTVAAVGRFWHSIMSHAPKAPPHTTPAPAAPTQPTSAPHPTSSAASTTNPPAPQVSPQPTPPSTPA